MKAWDQDGVLLALLRRCPGPSAAVESAAASFVGRARAAWPTITTVDPESIAQRVAQCVSAHADTVAGLDALDAGELWLCAACASGSRVAFDIFDAHYLGAVDAALRKMQLAPDQLQDVKQRVREKLLLPDADGRVRVLGYAGDGRLQQLVSVVAMRAAVDEIRARRVRPELGAAADADVVDRLLATDHSPEAGVLWRENREVIKEAFHAAVAALPALDRGILRMHVLEHLRIEDIAALHGVHRATAARWLARIRRCIGEHAREALRLRLGLGPAELHSLACAVESGIDLSLGRVLAPSVANVDVGEGDAT